MPSESLGERFGTVAAREAYRAKLVEIAMGKFVGSLSAHARAKEDTPDANPWARYGKDPVGFVTDSLREYIWSKQREICEAVVKHPRVAVKSCHESGKSFIAGRIPCWWIASHPQGEAFVLTSAPSFPQVRAILWREINRAHSRGGLPGYTNQTEWLIDNELVAFGRKPQDMDPSAFQGIHALHMLVVLDEACGIPKSLWDAAETLVANEGGHILAIGNPDDPGTEFAAVCRPGSGYHVITISAFDTPNFTDEDVPEDLRRRLIGRQWVEDRKRRWGETSPLYISKVLGEFPEVSKDGLIPISWIRQAVEREVEPGLPVELGVDVARSEMGNETVVIARRGSHVRTFGTLRVRDLMQVTGLVVQAIRETRPTRVKIDDTGLGGGVTDRLKEIQREGGLPHDVQIVPVLVGIPLGSLTKDPTGSRPGMDLLRRGKIRGLDVPPAATKDVLHFRDVKAQINWHVRSLFESGDIDIDPEDMDLQAQASAMRYTLNSRGQIVIESKEDMAQRLSEMGGMTGESGSPDRWDALVLAFAETGERKVVKIPSSVKAWASQPRGTSVHAL